VIIPAQFTNYLKTSKTFYLQCLSMHLALCMALTNIQYNIADIETHKPKIHFVKGGHFKGAGHSQAHDGNSLIVARIPCTSSIAREIPPTLAINHPTSHISQEIHLKQQRIVTRKPLKNYK
jgi:hypothetical protein